MDDDEEELEVAAGRRSTQEMVEIVEEEMNEEQVSGRPRDVERVTRRSRPVEDAEW